MDTRIVVVFHDSHADGNHVAAQIAHNIACQVFIAYGIRAALSLIGRERPEIAIFDERLAFVESRPLRELIQDISPATEAVLIKVVHESNAAGTSAAE